MPSPAPAPGANVVTSGSPYRAVLRLAMPTVLAMVTQSVVDSVDIFFFSRLPCPEASNAQAALLPSLILLWALGGSLSAISVGTQTIAARRFAETRHADSGTVLVNSWFFALLASLACTALGYLLLSPLLHLLIKVPEVRAVARTYLRWRLLGITSMVMTFSFKAFFDGIGKTHVHMVAAIIMNALNVLFCVAFIFGNFGAPRMGMAGAGFSAFLATWIGLFIMIVWAALPRYRRRYKPFSLRKLSAKLTGDILRLSIPSAVATLAVMSGFGLFSLIVSELDARSTAVLIAGACGRAHAINSAATMVIVGILKLTFAACLAFGTSTATLVSQSLGEAEPDKAARFGWVSVRLGLLIFGVVGLLEGVLFTRPMLSALIHSPAELEAAIVPMRMMGLFTPLIAVGMILTQALFGAGNTRYVMTVELTLHFGCLVPLAWLLGITLHFGLPGIWAAAVCYVIGLSSAMTFKFREGGWKMIRV